MDTLPQPSPMVGPGLEFISRTPIALFVFKRPAHTLRALEALAANPQFEESPLYVFCDSERHPGEAAMVAETRRIVATFPHPNKTLVTRSTNWGLAASITDGVNQLCELYGRVVVMEDDLIVSHSFLGFMHAALQHYETTPDVMQISGHSFPVASFTEQDEPLLLPFIGSWGWATWDRAWRKFDAQAHGWERLLVDRALRRRFDIDNCYPYTNMLCAQMRGEIDSWAIRWNWSVFKENGLVVYPPVSFVENIGFDGTGTHCSSRTQINYGGLAESFGGLFPGVEQISSEEHLKRYRQVKKSILRAQGSVFKRATKFVFHRTKNLIRACIP